MPLARRKLRIGGESLEFGPVQDTTDRDDDTGPSVMKHKHKFVIKGDRQSFHVAFGQGGGEFGAERPAKIRPRVKASGSSDYLVVNGKRGFCGENRVPVLREKR